MIEAAAKGETVVIAKAGKPLVKLVALDTLEDGHRRRLGFMEGQVIAPDDFDSMGRAQIEELFGRDPE